MGDLTGLLERARACRRARAGLVQALASEDELRAQLVEEMRGAGMPWRVVTDELGISRGWAIEILASRPGPVELEPAGALEPAG